MVNDDDTKVDELIALVRRARREGWYEDNSDWARVDELLADASLRSPDSRRLPASPFPSPSGSRR